MKQIKVLIVDDSALMRKMLETIIEEQPDMTVVGAAPDPFVARKMIKETNPDVITLDIEMPKMDGVEFLTKIMSLRPMPVVMISSLTQETAEITFKTLELGAVDYVGKPSSSRGEGLLAMADEVAGKIRAAAKAKVYKLDTTKRKVAQVSFSTTEQILAIGASTGGVPAIAEVLSNLPANAPGTLITQHMPKEFTSGFARRLNDKTEMKVSEARDGQRIIPGHAFVAPGDKHLELARSGANYICRLHDGPRVSGHKPSVDVLFNSVAKNAGDRSIGVILTGMGRDGASGLLEMRRAGAYTIGQDEKTSVVYGMCGAAYNIGAVEKQLPLGRIGEGILARLNKN